MKKFKLLPTILLLVCCVGILAVGVYAVTPKKHNITSNVVVTATQNPVRVEMLINDVSYGAREIRAGTTWECGNLSFNLDNTNIISDVPEIFVTFKITNLETATTDAEVAQKSIGAFFALSTTTIGDRLATADDIMVFDTIGGTESAPIITLNATPYSVATPGEEIELELCFKLQQFQEYSLENLQYQLYIENYQATATDLATCASSTGLVKLPVVQGTASTTEITTKEYSLTDYMFKGKKNVTHVAIPSTYVSLGAGEFNSSYSAVNGAFMNATGLVGVALPKTIQQIPDCAFYGCSALKNVSMPAVTYIGVLGFRSAGLVCIVLPESVTELGTTVTDKAYVFQYCRSLIAISMPGVTNIGSRSFANSTLLYNINCPLLQKIPAMMFQNCSSLINLNAPNTLSIGSNAFNNNTSLVNVYAPNVNSIEQSAFSECSNLISASFPKITKINKATFLNCTSLERANFPNVTTIAGGVNSNDNSPMGAFSGCSSLESINLPKANKIESYSFSNCTNLNSINLNAAQTIGANAFDGCTSLKSFTVPATVNAAIGANAFANTALESLIIKSTKAYTSFTDASAVFGTTWEDIIPQIYVPKTIVSANTNTYLNSNTFAKTEGTGNFADYWVYDYITVYNLNIVNGTVTGLYDTSAGTTDLVIPSTYSLSSDGRVIEGDDYYVTRISDIAFSENTTLTSVTIPDSIVTIGSWAFADCPNLTSVYIQDLTAWCNIDFVDEYGNPMCNGADLYLNGQLVTNLEIPSGITQIQLGAFEGCTSITSVTIPDGVKGIGDWAFEGCANLTSVTIPSSVEYIGEGAFGNGEDSAVYITDLVAWCNIEIDDYADGSPLEHGADLYLNGVLVTHLEIPSGVTVKYWAFYGCGSITSLTLSGETGNIDATWFDGWPNLTTCIINQAYDYNDLEDDWSDNDTICYRLNYYVLKTIVDDTTNNTNTYLNDETKFTKTEGTGDYANYYVYKPVATE